MFNQPVNKALREAVLAEYPFLTEDTRLLRMLGFLLWHYKRHGDLDTSPVSYNLLMSICQVKHRSELNGIEFLKLYKSHFPEFEFNPHYSKDKGIARTIINRGIPARIQELVDLYSGDKPNRFFENGEAISKNSVAREYRRREELAKDTKANSKEIQDILDYHNYLPVMLFSLKVSENFEETLKLLDTLDISEEAKSQQRQLLSKISVITKPFYLPTSPVTKKSKSGSYDVSGSSRIFPMEPTLLSLKRSLRKRLCKGWWDADLKSSQFRINAMLWDAPEFDEFLDANNIWESLTFGRLEAKDTVKTAIYSLFYGAGRARIEEDWDSEVVAVEEFFQHPMVELILEKRKAYLDKVMEEPPVCPLSGQKIYGSPTQRAAKIAQAYEVKLIYAIYNLWFTTEHGKHSNRANWSITLNQHDGVTIRFRDERSRESLQRKINRAIEKAGEEIGVKATLEWEKL